VLGGAAGIWSAVHRGRWPDRSILAQSFLLQAVPGFWVAILAILLFGAYLRWLPTSGADGWRHLVLPAIATAWVIVPRITLLVRASLLQTLGEDYVRTARAKGVGEPTIIVKHVLRNGVIPVLTYMGLLLGRLLGGTVITETVFGWPGLGRLAVEAAFRRDMGMVQTIALLFAGIVLVLNLVADLLTAVVDPRVRA
jgi:peptide/nickel transport system permease protein